MYKYVKRWLDIVISIVVLLLGAVPMVVIALLIKLDSSGPVLFKQQRYGKDKKIFKIYKFRTMLQNTPIIPPNGFKNVNDYITKLGKFLRKSSLDELPQLINVIKGDMSLVGPRPGSANNEEGLALIRQNRGVFAVRPGITGWAQINGRDELAHDETAKVEFDRYYIDHISFWMDLKCLFGTVWTVIAGKGYQEGARKNSTYEQKQEA